MNLPLDRLTRAFYLLDEAEKVLAHWLSDVRVLSLDHVEGRVQGTPFACLWANCHTLKSRRVDWTGRPRQVRPES